MDSLIVYKVIKEKRPLIASSSTPRCTTISRRAESSFLDELASKSEDGNYGKNVIVQLWVLSEQQVTQFLTDTSQTPSQLSVRDLIDQNSYLLIQVRNKGNQSIEGQLQFTASIFPQMSIGVRVPAQMQESPFYLISLGQPSPLGVSWPFLDKPQYAFLRWEQIFTFHGEDYEGEEEVKEG